MALYWRYPGVLPWRCHEHWLSVRIFGHTVVISIERRQVEIFFKRIQNNISYTHTFLMQQILPLKSLFFIKKNPVIDTLKKPDSYCWLIWKQRKWGFLLLQLLLVITIPTPWLYYFSIIKYYNICQAFSTAFNKQADS